MMKKTLIAVCSATVFLAACGGGDDDSPPPATAQVPASASESVTGLMVYLKALLVSDADTLEPVNVSAVTPPTDEMVPPVAID